MTKQLSQTLKGGMLCVSIALMASCHECELPSSKGDDLTMSVVASMSTLNEAAQSRYSGSDPNSMNFVVDDSIGIFVDDDEVPVKWTYISSGWAADGVVFWPDKTESHVFQAFYPYIADATMDNVPMPDLKEQDGTMAGLSKCDFLKAVTTQSYGTTGTVAFKGEGKSFVHVSSLLKLTLKGDEDLQSSTIDKISVSGENIVAPSSYSFENDEVTLSPDESSSLLDVGLAHEMKGADVSFYFILNAKSDASSLVTLTIEYTTNGKQYVASLDNFAGNVFAGGMQQSYSISVKDSYLIVSGSEISEWGKGETLSGIIINGQEK